MNFAMQTRRIIITLYIYVHIKIAFLFLFNTLLTLNIVRRAKRREKEIS